MSGKVASEIVYDNDDNETDLSIQSSPDNDVVFTVDIKYSKVKSSASDEQDMIVDIGCPKSLMGDDQWEELLKTLSAQQLERMIINPCKALFKFGPSKSHIANFKAEFPLVIDDVVVESNFLLLKGIFQFS